MAGSSRATKIPMIAITTSNSTSVNPVTRTCDRLPSEEIGCRCTKDAPGMNVTHLPTGPEDFPDFSRRHALLQLMPSVFPQLASGTLKPVASLPARTRPCCRISGKAAYACRHSINSTLPAGELVTDPFAWQMCRVAFGTTAHSAVSSPPGVRRSPFRTWRDGQPCYPAVNVDHPDCGLRVGHGSRARFGRIAGHRTGVVQ